MRLEPYELSQGLTELFEIRVDRSCELLSARLRRIAIKVPADNGCAIQNALLACTLKFLLV